MQIVAGLFFALVAASMAQKPSFAPNRPPGPSVLPQYEEGVAAQAAASILGDRFGAAASAPSEAATTSTQRPLTPEEQIVKNVYPSVDDELIRQISAWPKDKQPFWFVNAAHIQSHRGQQPGAPGLAPPATSINVPARSTFQRSS